MPPAVTRISRPVRSLIALVVIGTFACRPAAAPEVGFWMVRCDRAPGGGSALDVSVVVDSLGAATQSRLLVRLDSLHSTDGPQFDLPSGFIAQVFLRSGPGQGCANSDPASVELWAPGDQMAKTWMHLKSDRPASVTVVRGDGSIVSGPVMVEVGEVVPPIQWGER